MTEITTVGIAQMVTLMCLISVAVERATAIFINLSQLDQRITNSKINASVKQIAAAVFGSLIYATNVDAHVIFDPYFSGYVSYMVVGLMASGGSGFWNGILRLLSATTTKISNS